jgi:ATP-dependent RNA helicase DOB1
MDLFSFLDVAPLPDENNGDVDENEMRVDTAVVHGVKRKAESSISQTPTTNHESSEDFQAGPSEPKKLKTEPPNPVLLDDFETEAKREVAASAGLTGAVEAGSRLELRHQVCLELVWIFV